jgi:hypothetical protein
MSTLMGSGSRCAHRMRLIGGMLVCLAVCLAAAPASAELILADFEAVPSSSFTPYDLVWTGTASGGTLSAGPGMASNGDGNLPIGQQTAPGLMLQTPYVLSGGTVAGEIVGGASTFFYDSSLALSGLTASGTAVTVPVGTRTMISQPLAGGTFSFVGTDQSTVLLSGTFTDAVITGYQNSRTGAVLSMAVTYTGGKILSALPAGTHTGEFSWDLLSLNSPLAANGQGYLSSFSASATGQFSVTEPVPEPAALAILGVGSLGIAGFVCRRRRSS